ncbi:MAG: hypothetical protein KGQ67_11390 [Betaproteobacteria bacterium]|nr:hypothetical protein [Betaproteobacteria bacterium]
MGKLLSWIAIIALVYAGMRLFVVLQRKSRVAAARRAATRPAAPSGAAPERMLACDHCGVHAPASDMIVVGERRYCSPEHRDAARG